jgi:hypothetical protein
MNTATGKGKRFIIGICFALGIALATPTAALASTQYPSVGGRWDYGWAGFWPANEAWSNYYHKTKNHKSSVKTNNGKKNFYSACTAKGKTSKAQVYSFDTNSEHMYYNLC